MWRIAAHRLASSNRRTAEIRPSLPRYPPSCFPHPYLICVSVFPPDEYSQTAEVEQSTGSSGIGLRRDEEG